jgi:phosphate transport system protein
LRKNGLNRKENSSAVQRGLTAEPGLSKHTVLAFDADLQAIRAEVFAMARLVEQQIARSATALVNRDLQTSASVVAADATIDKKLHDLETRIVETIARRQPFAVDLREIIGAFHISHDLQRIGDLAKNVCRRVLEMDADIPKTLVPKIYDLSVLVIDCFSRVLDSYVERDDDKASTVWNSDKDIDELQNALFGEVLVCMMSDPRNLTSCTHLLFCLKNLERMGDHATNIAEAVHFMITGGRFAGLRPKAYDPSPILLPH